MADELLTTREAAQWAKVSESYLNKARLTGNGPRCIRIGRVIRYRASDLEAWTHAEATGPTSEDRDARGSIDAEELIAQIEIISRQLARLAASAKSPPAGGQGA